MPHEQQHAVVGVLPFADVALQVREAGAVEAERLEVGAGVRQVKGERPKLVTVSPVGEAGAQLRPEGVGEDAEAGRVEFGRVEEHAARQELQARGVPAGGAEVPVGGREGVVGQFAARFAGHEAAQGVEFVAEELGAQVVAVLGVQVEGVAAQAVAGAVLAVVQGVVPERFEAFFEGGALVAAADAQGEGVVFRGGGEQVEGGVHVEDDVLLPVSPVVQAGVDGDGRAEGGGGGVRVQPVGRGQEDAGALVRGEERHPGHLRQQCQGALGRLWHEPGQRGYG